jgi:prolyl oligopeptidase
MEVIVSQRLNSHRNTKRKTLRTRFIVFFGCTISFALFAFLHTLSSVQAAVSKDGAPSSIKYPKARRTEDADVYHGVRVSDPYRWLENLDAPDVKQWLSEETEIAVTQGKSFSSLDSYRARIRQIQKFQSLRPPFQAGDKLVYIETPGNLGGSSIGDIRVYVQRGISSSPSLLLDPEKLFPDRNHEINGIAPSNDGRFLAYGVSKISSRWLQWRVLNIETGQTLPDLLEDGNSYISSFAWAADSKGFYYGRFRKPDTNASTDAKVEYEKLYFHRLGTPQSTDQLILENAEEGDRWFAPSVSEDGQQLIVVSDRGTSGNMDVFLKLLSGEAKDFQHINANMNGRFSFLGNKGSISYFLTDWDAPRQQIVAFNSDAPKNEAAWTTVVRETKERINHASLVADHFIMELSQDAAPVYKIFGLDGSFQREISMPSGGNVWGAPWGPGFVGKRTDQEAFFVLTGMADPGSVYRLNPATGQISLWKRPKLSFDPDQFVTEHAMYQSKDGTSVPIFIVHRKDFRRNGSNPTWLYGYGALSWSSFPWFQPQMVAWVENGGVFALAGVRGGGEFGETWHEQGIRTNRQRAIDDYVSAAEWLIQSGITSHSKLVANGNSLSGSLPAAASIQHPDLFAAVVIDYPVLDMIRYANHTGARMWISELGSVENPAEFRALLNYSPYHNIKQGVCYPPTIIEDGTHDETAFPSHAYKFTAALQAAQGCDNPVLLLAVEGAGHGFGTTPEQAADTTGFELAFVTKALKLP